jgi:hypothetical protein
VTQPRRSFSRQQQPRVHTQPFFSPILHKQTMKFGAFLATIFLTAISLGVSALPVDVEARGGISNWHSSDWRRDPSQALERREH